MAKAPTGPSQESDNLSFLILVSVFICLAYIYVKYNIENFMFIWKYLRIVELSPFYILPKSLPFYGDLNIPKAIKFLLNTNSVDISIKTVLYFDNHYLPWISWLPGSFFIYYGIKRICMTNNCNNRYDMEKLLVRVHGLYPNLSELTTRNPIGEPLIYNRKNKASYYSSMGLSPKDFSLLSPPLGLEKEAKKDKSMQQSIWNGKKDFDFDLAERTFAKQLGEKFCGIQNLAEVEKKVFDILKEHTCVNHTIKIKKYKKYAKDILNLNKNKKINTEKLIPGEKQLYEYISEDVKKLSKKRSFNPKKYIGDENLTKIIANEKNKRLQDIFKLYYAEKIMEKHAFVKTGLMELFYAAKNTGVITTELFKWVKKTDRILWFCLSSVGRKVSFTESSGPFSHWLLEQDIGRPITHPEVSEAVQGLWIALKCDKED